MTKQDKNVEIAKMLGFKLENTALGRIFTAPEKWKKACTRKFSWVPEEGLKFHSDWTWAMTAMDMVGNLGAEGDYFPFLFTIQPTNCSVEHVDEGWGTLRIVDNTHGATLLEMVFETLYLFAEYYNGQKRNT